MNRYAQLTPEQLEEHFSFYLIDSWSYSAVSTFARNEKAFEKEYIYRERGRRSSSSIAGNAYHAALEWFFLCMKNHKELPSLIDLQQEAYTYIDEVPANEWKLQKTTPTIEEAKADAVKKVNAALINFMTDQALYTGDIATILGVEERIEQWIIVNGVDIPLPCHSVIDIIAELKDGRTVIIDHKLKSAYTDEKEVVLTRGKQAINYVIQYETAHPGVEISEVRFFENKVSANKDKSPQIRMFSLPIDKDSRRLYEALLYEPLRRMIEAVSDPDYIFTINDSDNLTDRAELYEFWSRTQLAEVQDFNIPEGKATLIEKRLRKIKDSGINMVTPKVITAFRKNAASFISYDYSMTDMNNQQRIEHVLRTFAHQVRVAHEISGFSSDTYLLECGPGIRIANIENYRLDIASALNVPNVRISKSLVEYDGKAYLAVESNKKNRETLPWSAEHLDGHRIPLGMDNFRNVIVWDLGNPSTPHMLVCGATGSGKSVFLRSVIEYAKAAGIHNITVVDPKYEFTELEGVHVYNEIEDIEDMMKEEVKIMQNSAKFKGPKSLKLIIIDEFADAISQARSGKALDIVDSMGKIVGREKSLEENLKMLAQKGRALGYRIVAAIQRASTKIITGDTKVNFPVQVCFRVPKAIDSNVVIDEDGAESLAGHGDGLIKSPEYLDTVRFQGFYYK